MEEENKTEHTSEEIKEEVKQEPQKEEIKTQVNDPDLLIGPYKPKEGEPPTVKCPNCGDEMPTTISTCVSCGHYLKENENASRYQPMDEKKVKKIRWIIGVICIVAFIILMIVRNI